MSKDNTKPFAKHNGVQIFITEGGQFVAEVNGERMTRPSVAAIKKLIEKKATFEPFAAIDEARGYGHADVTKGTIKTLTIVGAKKNPRGSSWANNLWIDDKGQTHSTVIPDTPENRAAMQALIDKRYEFALVDKAQEAELRKLECKIAKRNLDKELTAAETAKVLKANGSDALEPGATYKLDHSRKGKFVAKLLKINGEFADVEIVDGEAVMLSSWNENGQPGDTLTLRTDLAKWERVQ
jgi:hypothetical protein